MNRNILIEKLVNNINETNNGSIIASPTKNNPNYFYHWIRDSAITIKAILQEYIRNSKPELLHIILKYINFEYKLQNLNSISGLGEPKYNVDGTTFNESWGRPQNDGPALRGLIMLSIKNILNYNLDIINLNIINIIIKKDLEYVLNNYRNESFDLWEEKKGHHFYTRVVQAKFLKEYINNFNDKSVENDYQNIKNLINNHFMEDLVISSFDNNNKILRVNDSSIFMCLNHIDYDYDIVPFCKYNLVKKNINNLLQYFNKKYNGNYNLVGRYEYDKYFDGQAWFICTISMLSFFKKTKNNKIFVNNLIEYIQNLNKNLDLSEQFNPQTNEFISVKRLTWNYSELYFYLTI